MAAREPFELWSAGDDRDVAAFLSAVEKLDLTRALFAIEGVEAGVARDDESRLDAWAERVRTALPEGAGRTFGETRALAQVLGEELGFRGDPDDYYDPKNSLLHEVLERRRGMPILLSSVWMAVGRRAGIAVAGIGMPGHFIVRVGSPTGVFVDPFAGGAELTVEECRLRVEKLSSGKLEWRKEFLREATLVEVVERVLQNLFSSYRRERNGVGQYRAASFLAALRPDSADRQLQRAEAAFDVGAFDVARLGYEAVVEAFPETHESERAAERLAQAPGGFDVN